MLILTLNFLIIYVTNSLGYTYEVEPYAGKSLASGSWK